MDEYEMLFSKITNKKKSIQKFIPVKSEHLIEEFQKEVDRRWGNLLYKCDR